MIPSTVDLLAPHEPLDFRTLKLRLHNAGINMRYIGHVRYHVPKENVHLRFLLLIEAFSRTAKEVIRFRLREQMKSCKVIGEEPYKREVIR